MVGCVMQTMDLSQPAHIADIFRMTRNAAPGKGLRPHAASFFKFVHSFDV